MMELQQFYELAEREKKLFDDIYVCVPSRPHDGICNQLAMMLSNWFLAGIKWRELEDSMGGFIEITRTKIALDFLRNRPERFLLMIDNDTEPPLELPWLLARHDEGIVGSCITSMSREGRPMLCFTRQDTMGQTRFPDFQDGEPMPATGLIEVPHCGTGAMLIRRDVLESWKWELEGPCPHCGEYSTDIPFFIPSEVRVKGAVHGVVMQGEDMVFCRHARQKGYKVYVDLEAHCGHRKSMRLGYPAHQRDPSLRAADWRVPAKGLLVQSD